VDYFTEPSLDEPTFAAVRAIEYDLIAAGIALAIIAAVYSVGPVLASRHRAKRALQERRRDHLQARLQGSKPSVNQP